MDPNLVDPDVDVAKPMGGDSVTQEISLTTVKPSVKVLIPSFIGWVVVGACLTFLVVYALGTYGFLADMASGSVVAGLLAVIWAGCLLPVLFQLLMLKTTSYSFSNQRLEYTRGILSRRRDQIELVRIRDITTNRSLTERLLGLGTVVLDTVDRSHPILKIPAQSNAYQLADWIHQLNTAEKQRLNYREFEGTQTL